MPRKLKATMTLDALEDEILYTIAALGADENTPDMVGIAQGWLDLLDEVRALDRRVRIEAANVDATRMVRNEYLDTACTRFGYDLFVAVGRDRSAYRWTQYFKVAVSSFIRIGLRNQVATVKGWLGSGTSDQVLEQHRAELTKRSAEADDALVRTEGLAMSRGQLWQAREALAQRLTDERDALHDTLSARAREQSMSRTWPDVFFRSESAREEQETPPSTPA